MYVHHSSQFCPFSRIQGIILPLPRKNHLCSSSFSKPSYVLSHEFVRSYSYSINGDNNITRKSRFVVRSRDVSPESFSQSSIKKSNKVDGDSSGTWLVKWKETRQLNPRKSPQPEPVLNYRSTDSVLNSFNSNGSSNGSSTGGGSTMDRIVEKLKKFGFMDDDGNDNDNDNDVEKGTRIEKGSVEDIFYVEEGMLPNTQGGFDESSLGIEQGFNIGEEVRFPWEKPAAKVEESEYSVKRKSRTYMAQLTLPESEMSRLRRLTLKTKKKLRIGGAGVTQSVVDAINEQWKTSEIVRIKVEGAPALNMRRMHEILERKTGGLVIWRSGTSVSLYRGVSYEDPLVDKKRQSKRMGAPIQVNSLLLDSAKRNSLENDLLDSKDSEIRIEKEFSEGQIEVKYEDEIDKLLSKLGPRYTDWPGDEPFPVDADLLLSVMCGYQPPFRLLPYGVRRSLGAKEATTLKRIARTLPPHFALGRSRHLEGLAAAIVKLWERSSIAKIALKRSVQLTTSEKMAEELKRLTGGLLLSRNKDFLVFYRGKNFLSSDVTDVLLERERLSKALQDTEEQARMRASESIISFAGKEEQERAAGTLSETLHADAKWGKRPDNHEAARMLKQVEVIRHVDLVRKLERKLAFAERKLMKAEKTLSKVEEFLRPADHQPDPNCITDEERFMFRKLGLKMKAFLILGRRGVFDGTVENMHLHWKYRELVKIIVKAKNFEDVKSIALSLEAESGGVLVSVDKVSKGYAIIVFRGKDYHRPSTLRPKNLLTKRKALARSIELQRREALLKHVTQLQKNVEKLRSEIGNVDMMKDEQNTEFYDSLDSAYPSEDEDSEEEGEEAYLASYGTDEDDSSGDEINNNDIPEYIV